MVCIVGFLVFVDVMFDVGEFVFDWVVVLVFFWFLVWVVFLCFGWEVFLVMFCGGIILFE